MAMASSRKKLQLVFMVAPFLLLAAGAPPAAAATSNDSSSSSVAAADALIRASWSLSSFSQSVFSLDRYGARGDGRHDDTPALARAWKAACASPRPATVLAPGAGRRYLLKVATLSGPCRSSVTVTVQGTLVASPDRADWSHTDRRHWIVFRGVARLTVNGGGAVDGSGGTWWRHSCKVNRALPCTVAPTALSFLFCTGLRVQDLKIVNSQQIHVSIEDCTNAQVARLSITAPGTSPNTDGIHITRSRDVQVTNCKIRTGDDCLSIETGTHNLHVSQIVCGPGHGISIGSLGDGGSRAEVSGVTVDGARLYGTANGARIKTYQGGSGYARDITFQNMAMSGVANPIVIDQSYCDAGGAAPCERGSSSAVEVSRVAFRNIRGTAAGRDAIRLSCSRSVPCRGITLQNIDLRMEAAGGGGVAGSTCRNAMWRRYGTVVPQPCTAKD